MNLDSLGKPPFSRFEAKTWQFLKFFPDLPKWLTSFLAKVAAPLAVILGVLSLLSLPLSIYHPIDIVSALIGGILLLSAYKPLRLKRHFGITLLFWNAVFQSILGLSQALSPTIVLILIINLYLLYQIKLYFTKK